jgi:hypothetical protein
MVLREARAGGGRNQRRRRATMAIGVDPHMHGEDGPSDFGEGGDVSFNLRRAWQIIQ